MINESFNFDAMDTPGKKRKREYATKFTSSTPIKLNNKENCLFSDTLCLEVKSIAALVREKQKNMLPPPSDFEVIRKPPKKKKKMSSAEDSCFTNSALDLKKDDEKVINPFEVVRTNSSEAKALALGVTNPALDVKNEPIEILPSKPISTNPFEVERENSAVCGIDNAACEINTQAFSHEPLVLPLPFTPALNYRIDFSNMPDNLTPSTLLASKLILENNEAKIAVTTPMKNTTTKLMKSLSVISEENDLDIGEELDNYQLQLENSINEAKIQKNNKITEQIKFVHVEEEKKVEEIRNVTYTKEKEEAKEVQITVNDTNNIEEQKDEINYSHEGFHFEEVDSFDDIQNLGQFKRAYRKDDDIPISNKNSCENVSNEPNKKSKTIGKSIRKSIRKLMHIHPHHNEEHAEKKDENDKPEGLLQSIRQSLRRKPKPKIQQVSLETSIVGRTVFREKTNNDEQTAHSLERKTLKRNIIKSMKTFMESVEEFDHY